MTLLSFLVGVAAAAGLLGMICRLNLLTWAQHDHAVIAMHLGMAFGCVWTLGECVELRPSPGSIGTVLATVAWLWVSLPTWRAGPPLHTARRSDREGALDESAS